MKVREVMSSPVATCSEDMSVDTVATIMDKQRIGALVIVKDDVPVGIVSSRDLAINVVAKDKTASETPVKDAMSTYLVSTDANTSVEEVAKIFGEKRLRRILVTDEGKLVGIVTARRLLVREPKSVVPFLQSVEEAEAHMKLMDFKGAGLGL